MRSINSDKIMALFIVLCLTFTTNTVSVMGASEANKSEIQKFLEDVHPGEMNYGEIQKFLESLRREIEEAKIQDKWDDYLERNTGFKNQEHWLVIAGLGAEFIQDIGKLNDCEQSSGESKREYSSDWLKDFLKEFDEEYVSRNLGSIRFVVLCAWVKFDTAVKCESFVKEAIYKEIFYFHELREYARHFVKFSESLDKDTQKNIKGLVTYAKTITEIPDNMLGYMYAVPGVRRNLYSAALKSRKDIDPRLIEFFSSHDFFSKPFDAIRVVRDLKRFEKKE